jgi:hypothetical protein
MIELWTLTQYKLQMRKFDQQNSIKLMAKTITWKTKGNGKKGRAKKGQKMCNPQEPKKGESSYLIHGPSCHLHTNQEI